MNTVGNIIKDARLKKGFSRTDLGDLTHIRTTFIAAIETGDWEKLPDFAILSGFVKSIAHFLDIDETLVMSTFRREYPPKLRELEPKMKKNPMTKELNKKIVWGPRITFLIGVFIVIFVVLGYLGFQYKKFNAPPTLSVSEPTENQTVNNYILEVDGKTDSDATVSVNDQPVIVDNSGSYTTQIEVSKDTNLIVVRAKSRSGKETTVSRRIRVAL